MATLTALFNSMGLRNNLLPVLNNVRTLKTALKIKWVRPVKLPQTDPNYSGDRKPINKYKLETPMINFEDSVELQTADENVKKIFQMDLNTTAPKLFRYRKELCDLVKRHPLDVNSHEFRIAEMTATIRYLQEYMVDNPKKVKSKVRLLQLIDKRKKQLKHLRRWDYARFEWILEKLDLIYRPHPNIFDRVTRKKSMTQLTTIHCEELKDKKICEYRRKMDQQKVPFLEKKLQKLRWIRDQEKTFKLPETVNAEMIEECEKQLHKVRLSILDTQGYETVIHPYTLEKYNPAILEAAEKKKADAESETS